MRVARHACRVCLLAAALGSAACGSKGGTTTAFAGEDGKPSPSRAGTVVVEACQLDPWQTAQLASPSAQSVLQTVVLLCPAAHDDGTVTPSEDVAKQELATQVSQIQGMGYRAHLGLTMADELGNPYAQDVVQQSLASATWRANVTAAATALAAGTDGVDLELPPPPSASIDDVTSLVASLAAGIGALPLGVFVPPGGDSNDVAGSGAYDLAAIGDHVARIHVETLDYSCCTGAPGPTIDPGWAVDVERAAAGETTAPLDVAVPLYGWDFGPSGQRSVSYLEAQGVAASANASPQRGPTGAVYFDWTDAGGGAHETWYDDGTSTSWTLAAWDTKTLPPSVGVVFWGLGSEDPALWDTLAQEQAP